MAPSRSAFIRLWLVPVCLVVLLRLIHSTTLGYDPAIQLQAARNLLNGRGLTVYSIPGESDLSAPNRLQVLTYFPAGYSVCAAAVLALGCSAFSALKFLGAAATILGWWGWARLAYFFMRDGLERSAFCRAVAIAIAIVTPFLTTPPWTGTDIFLWATVPWIMQFLTRSARSDGQYPIYFDLAAGALCGLAILMRYQALFLAAYACLLIALQSFAKVSLFFRRIALFVLGLAPFVGAQIFVNCLRSNTPLEAGGISFHQDGAGLAHFLWTSISFVTAANYSFIWWFPARSIDFLTQFGGNAPWLLVITLIALPTIPVAFAIRIGHGKVAAAARDARCASMGLIIALPLFLCACALGGVMYAGVPRYYVPVIPLAVLAAYAYAVGTGTTQKSVAYAARVVAIAYLTGFLCSSLLRIGLLAMPGDLGDNQRGQLLGSKTVGHWFSSKPEYAFSSAREYVVGLLREHPETILVTNRENWFYAEPDIDHSRLHRLEDLRSSYVTGAARIVILAEESAPSADTSLQWYRSWGKAVPAHYFESVPGLHLLRRFPEENIKILEAEIPAGTKIELKHPAQT